MIFQFTMSTPGLCKKVSMVYTMSIIIITTPRHIDEDKDARARPIHSLQHYSTECWDQIPLLKNLPYKKKHSAETSERPWPLKVKQSSNSVEGTTIPRHKPVHTLHISWERKKHITFSIASQILTRKWYTQYLLCLLLCFSFPTLSSRYTKGWLPLELIKTTNAIAATISV